MTGILDLLPIAPEAALAAAAVVMVFISITAFTARRTASTALAFAGACAAAYICTTTGLSGNVGGLLVLDRFSAAIGLIVASALALGALSSMHSREIPDGRYPEYLLLLILTAMALVAAASSTNLLMLYLSLETAGISSYALAAFNPASGRSAEAGLKYSIYGATASGAALFGISILYGLAGGLDFSTIRSAAVAMGGSSPGSLMLHAGVLLFLGALLFKIAAFPFHAWCPDAYEGAPTPFTAFLSVAPKAAGFAALARFCQTAMSVGSGMFETPDGPAGVLALPLMLGGISIVTMTVGNFAAIMQSNVKRMLAWSSIAHAGYIMMGIATYTVTGLQSVVAYLAIYLVMNFGAFYCVIAAGRFTEAEFLENWKGMSRRLPAISAAFAVFLLSLAGIPPLGGFIGKFYLFSAVISKGGAFFWVLALTGVMNSVVSLYYYARILKKMYMEEPPADAAPAAVFTIDGVLVVALAIAVLLLGVWWSPLAEFAKRAAAGF